MDKGYIPQYPFMPHFPLLKCIHTYTVDLDVVVDYKGALQVLLPGRGRLLRVVCAIDVAHERDVWTVIDACGLGEKGGIKCN